MNVYFYRNGYFYYVETIISVGVLPLEKSASGKQGFCSGTLLTRRVERSGSRIRFRSTYAGLALSAHWYPSVEERR
jgi:hypothetical protein